ncbi:Jerky-like protein [Camponotus japonicus]
MAESSQNLMQKKTTLYNQRRATEFIQKFTRRLEEEHIIKDNIYTMIDMLFTLKTQFHKRKEQIKKIGTNIEILKDDSLSFMFCTNATGSHKLLPFCTYKYKNAEAIKYLENTEFPFLSKFQSSELEAEDNFVDWYNNYFTNSVKRHRENTNIRGKVLLLLNGSKKFFSSREIIKDNCFEILLIPNGACAIFQPLDLKIRSKIRRHFYYHFQHFCTSGDIGNLIEETCMPWTEMTSVDIKELWMKLFELDFSTKKDNITEEDIAVEEISKPQNSRETDRDKQKHQENTVSAENSGRIENTESTEDKVGEEDYLQTLLQKLQELIDDTDLSKLLEMSTFYAITEAEGCPKEQEDIKNAETENIPSILEMHDITEQSVSPYNLTEYLSFYGKAEGCQKEQEDIKNTQTENIPPILEMHNITEQFVSSDNLTEYLSSYGKTEGCQKEQEDIKNTQTENIPAFIKIMHDITEQFVSPDNLTEYLNTYGKAEGCQKEQEDIKNIQTENIPPILEMHVITEQFVSPDNLTEYPSSYGKAEGCQKEQEDIKIHKQKIFHRF